MHQLIVTLRDQGLGNFRVHTVASFGRGLDARQGINTMYLE